MELLNYLHILRKHALMITLLCLTAIVSAVAFTFLLPEQYEATALVLVRPQENIKVSSNKNEKELLNYPVGQGSNVQIPSNTYIEVIKARSIAEKVVRNLHLDTLSDEAEGTFLQRLFDSIKKAFNNLSAAVIQIVKYGRIMPPLPPFDKAVQHFQKGVSAKAIKDTYIFEITFTAKDPKLAATVANVAADLFLEHVAQGNMSNARAISAFVGERLSTIEQELEEARRTYREFKEKNKTVSFKEETSAEIKAISELESDLEKAEVRLVGLLKTLTPANPRVQVVEAEKRRLMATLKQRKAELRHLPEKERQLLTLNLNVFAAEDIYQLVRKEYEEARIREGMHITEMTVASYAVPPAYPAKPIRGTYAAAALAVALVIGIGLAFLLEYVNTTLRTVEDVERALRLQVLATLPSMRPTAGFGPAAAMVNRDR